MASNIEESESQQLSEADLEASFWAKKAVRALEAVNGEPTIEVQALVSIAASLIAREAGPSMAETELRLTCAIATGILANQHKGALSPNGLADEVKAYREALWNTLQY